MTPALYCHGCYQTFSADMGFYAFTEEHSEEAHDGEDVRVVGVSWLIGEWKPREPRFWDARCGV